MMIGIIEENDKTRQELESFLRENNIAVSFAARTAVEFLDNAPVAADNIQLLLFSLDPEGENNLEHVSSIKEFFPDTKILVVSREKSDKLLMQTLETGVDGYYLMRMVPFRLVDAINETMKGGVYIEPSVAKGLVERLFPSKGRIQEKTFEMNDSFVKKYNLTDREVQIAEGLVAHKLYKEIAYDHRVSINTVRYYVKTLYKKIGVNNRQQLIRLLTEE